MNHSDAQALRIRWGFYSGKRVRCQKPEASCMCAHSSECHKRGKNRELRQAFPGHVHCKQCIFPVCRHDIQACKDWRSQQLNPHAFILISTLAESLPSACAALLFRCTQHRFQVSGSPAVLLRSIISTYTPTFSCSSNCCRLALYWGVFMYAMNCMYWILKESARK